MRVYKELGFGFLGLNGAGNINTWSDVANLAQKLGFIVGKVVYIPGWSSDIIIQGTLIFIVCSILTILLSTPVAFFASVGRGYLSPLGFMVFTIVLAQIIAATGYGQFFPWSIPALVSSIAGSDNAMIEGISIIIVFLTSTFGVVGTMFW